MKKIAVVGAGGMARTRVRALLATGKTEIVAVASRRLESAKKFAAEIQCPNAVDDFQSLARFRPDAVLVEVPHQAQDAVVLWALESGFNTLIGGCLAASSESAEKIRALTEKNKLLVEAGFEARYTACWQAAKVAISGGQIGDLVAVRSFALWDGNPDTWYYRQHDSGGMPLTHMTYCFINPIRWIAGNPTLASAFANRKWQTGPGKIDEETCVANILLPGDILGTLTAGFVKPGDYPSWSVTFLGTKGILDVLPSEQGDGGSLIHYDRAGTRRQDFTSAQNGFEAQAHAFLDSLDGTPRTQNPPHDVLWDIRTAEGIVRSVKTRMTVTL